ncbi:MAG: PKD domain-containing protein, partial [Proteobacteria bacterium]|nr:PKD domain-containing protein [Pseudomonadota bacterium]
MKKIIFVSVFLISLNSFADGCSGAASFIATYDSTQCCWTFQNTTTNDCMQWNCSWDFGDGSPIVTTPQGQGTTCHYYANPGTYTVTLIFDSSPCHGGGGNICYGNQSVTIPPLSVNPTVSNYIIDSNTYNVSCEGGNDGWINLNLGVGYTFQWLTSPPQFSDSIGNLTAGTYTCNIALNGCVGVFNITLTEPNLDGIATINDASCFGYTDGSINFSPVGGSPPFQYTWSNSSIGEDPIALSASTYYLFLTDSFGCTETFQYQVSEPSQINVLYSVSVINGYNVTCNNGQDGFIDLTV